MLFLEQYSMMEKGHVGVAVKALGGVVGAGLLQELSL